MAKNLVFFLLQINIKKFFMWEAENIFLFLKF